MVTFRNIIMLYDLKIKTEEAERAVFRNYETNNNRPASHRPRVTFIHTIVRQMS